MKSAIPDPNISAEPADFTPTEAQIDALARRLMPEIKKFFADEQIRREFAEWRETHNTDK